MTDESPDVYQLLQVITPDRTFLCSDASNNIVVLKRLDDDCLYRNQLHPNIRDRLAKVREMAHPRVATIRSVERWNGHACLVWVYLDGETWDDVTANPVTDRVALAHSLTTTVCDLHDLGIVHGNLHGRNIIVRHDGQVWLTDISPYLYSNPKVDLDAVAQLLPVGLPQKRMTSSEPPKFVEGHQRFLSLLAAALVIVLAVGFGVMWRWKSSRPIDQLPPTFPSLKQPLHP